MKLSKTGRGGTYVAIIKTPHGLRRVPTKQTTLEDAKRVVADAHIEEIERQGLASTLTAQAVSLVMTGRQLTLDKAFEEFLQSCKDNGMKKRSMEICELVVSQWMKRGGYSAKHPSEITPANIASFVNAEDDAKLNTRNLRLWGLRVFFGWCADKGFLFGNPARVIKRPDLSKLTHEQKETKGRKVLTAEEVEKIIAGIEQHKAEFRAKQAKLDGSWIGNMSRAELEERVDEWDFLRCAVLVGIHAGLRLSDICNLEWATITPGYLQVWTKKGSKRVNVPMAPELVEVFAGVKHKDDTYVWPKARADYAKSHAQAHKSRFVNLCAQVGCPGHSFHDTRATFIANCRAKGIPMPHIALWVGHSSIETTKGYVE